MYAAQQITICGTSPVQQPPSKKVVDNVGEQLLMRRILTKSPNYGMHAGR